MEAGEKFPAFILPDENGMDFDSELISNIRHIIYFYPKDNTPGCTQEAIDFNEIYQPLMVRNIPIIGISGDSAESHRKFIEKNDLKLKLLTDKDHVLAEKVGAWGRKRTGKDGIIRSTFIIGKDGTIEAVWYNVKVDGHANIVYEKVKSLVR